MACGARRFRTSVLSCTRRRQLIQGVRDEQQFGFRIDGSPQTVGWYAVAPTSRRASGTDASRNEVIPITARAGRPPRVDDREPSTDASRSRIDGRAALLRVPWFAWATRQVSPDGVMIERGEQRGGIHRRVKAGQAEGGFREVRRPTRSAMTAASTGESSGRESEIGTNERAALRGVVMGRDTSLRRPGSADRFVGPRCRLHASKRDRRSGPHAGFGPPRRGVW